MTNNGRVRLAAIVAVVSALATFIMPGQAMAYVRQWIGGYSTRQEFLLWYNGSLWSPAGVPAKSDQAYVFEGYPHAGSLSIDGGSVVVDAANAPAGIFGGDVFCGDEESGTIWVRNGANFEMGEAFLGMSATGWGRITVSGAGSTWSYNIFPDDIFLGQKGKGTLTIKDGAAVSRRNAYLGRDTASQGWATVTGAGSTWDNSDDLYVGKSGIGTLTIADGGTTSNGIGYLGLDSTGWGQATVRGPGSAWINKTFLYVGNDGTAMLTIEDGGAVSNRSGHVGYHTGSRGQVSVAGLGSTWTTLGPLYVGQDGTGTLAVRRGGSVINVVGYLGLNAGSRGQATVSGTDSVWATTNELYVGNAADGILTVEDGGTVSNTLGYLGFAATGSGQATVRGAGSMWNNDGELYVGKEGTGLLEIRQGGRVTSQRAYIGYEVDSQGAVTVDGAGSTWDNSGWNMYVGELGHGELTITNGGTVLSNLSSIGADPRSTGKATVDGPGSRWTCTADLDVGVGTLAITGGGKVSSTAGYVGEMEEALGQVTVSGTGSIWTVGSGTGISTRAFQIGSATGGRGSLTITDGGTVLSNLSAIGDVAGSTGKATVDGPGSTWTCTGGLDVGNHGTGTLEITGGGKVASTAGYVGHADGGVGQVTVTGAGSTWTVGSGTGISTKGLAIGSAAGSSGTLTITDGGTVAATYVSAGHYGISGDVTVSGAGSTLTTSGNLAVGNSGASTGTLTIQDGATVRVGDILNVAYAAGSVGTVNLQGGTLSAGRIRGVSGDYTFNWTGGTLEVTGYDVGVGSTRLLGENVELSPGKTLDVAMTTVVDDGATLAVTGGGLITDKLDVSGTARLRSGAVTIRDTFAVRPSGVLELSGQDLVLPSALTVEGLLDLHDATRLAVPSLAVPGAFAEIVVSGERSTLTSGSSIVLGDSTRHIGLLTVQDGATVRAPGTVDVRDGTVNLRGGTLSAGRIQSTTGDATFNWTGGRLEVTNYSAQVGSTRLLGDYLDLSPGKTLDVRYVTVVDDGATLAVTGGGLITDKLDVSGTARLLSGPVTIRDTFTIRAGGRVEVSDQDLALAKFANIGGSLSLDGTGLSAPELWVLTGATLDFDSGMISLGGSLTNDNVIRMGTSGPATVRAAVFGNRGSLLGEGTIQASFINQANVALSGDSSFSGDVRNETGSKIVISGGSDVTFFEDVDNQSGAEIRVSENSSATYFGAVTGAGSFTGTGTSYIEGDMRPGASPGTMAFDGDVVFGPGARLQIELGGTEPGRFDVLEVGGLASLGGTLEIALVDGFVPVEGDTFEIFKYGDLRGDFGRYEGLDLGNGRRLEFNLTPEGMAAIAVPEPSTFALLLLAVAVLAASARRRPRVLG